MARYILSGFDLALLRPLMIFLCGSSESTINFFSSNFSASENSDLFFGLRWSLKNTCVCSSPLPRSLAVKRALQVFFQNSVFLFRETNCTMILFALRFLGVGTLCTVLMSPAPMSHWTFEPMSLISLGRFSLGALGIPRISTLFKCVYCCKWDNSLVRIAFALFRSFRYLERRSSRASCLFQSLSCRTLSSRSLYWQVHH